MTVSILVKIFTFHLFAASIGLALSIYLLIISLTHVSDARFKWYTLNMLVASISVDLFEVLEHMLSDRFKDGFFMW